MFYSKAYSDGNNDKKALIFIKSKYIKVYPCGRRSAYIQENGQYIPFDPEARLNTELNNRKHTSLNGFADTYVKSWDTANGEFTLVLDGYDFVITLKDNASLQSVFDFSETTNFVDGFLTALKEVIEVTSLSEIYANIRIEEIPLLSGGSLDYNTWVLRNQSDTASASYNLDLLVEANTIDPLNVDNYYFTGLSFSTTPLTNKNTLPYSVFETTDSNNVRQKIISLRILDNLAKQDSVNNELAPRWTVHEPAYLPVIKHGDFPGAVAVEKLAANKSIKAESIYLDGPVENLLVNSTGLTENAQQVPALSVLRHTKGEKLIDYQLKFTFGSPLTFDTLAERPKTGALKLGEGILGWHALSRAGFANLKHPTIHSAPEITLNNNRLVINRKDDLHDAFQFSNVKVYYIGNICIDSEKLVENSVVFPELGKNFIEVNGNDGYLVFYPENNEFENLPELNNLGNYIVSVTYKVTGRVSEEDSPITKTFITHACVKVNNEPAPTISGKDLEVSLDENNQLVIKTKDNNTDLSSGCFIKCWIYYLSNITIGNLEENYKTLDDIGRNFPDINSEVGYQIYYDINNLPKLSASGNYVVAVKYKNNANDSETYVKYLPLEV